MSNIKHLIGISGGKDSAALAIYLYDKYPDLPVTYYFCDTGKELDETYQLVKKHFHIYEKLRSHVRNSSELGNRKALWYRIIENESDKIELSIYSGKM